MQKVGDWPVLNLGDRFQFACHKGLSCFTQCCQKLEVMLTPYDILRLKNALNISSDRFLEKYTETVFSERLEIPLVKLKKIDNRCPFLSSEGCKIYKDRPSVCRLYPLGRGFSNQGKEVYFLIKEKECLGFEGSRKWTVASWVKAQGIEDYDKYNKGFSEIILLKAQSRPHGFSLKEARMFFMACYNLDAFKEFVFKSSFLKKFDLSPKRMEKIKKKEPLLLQLAFDWLKFALFGKPTLRIKSA